MPRAEVANWASTSGKSGRRLTDHGRRPKHAVWQRKQIWNMDRKEIHMKKCQQQKWQIGRQQVANWAKGEKQLYSRNQWTCVSFFNWKLIALVLTISILCLGDHFQWKKFSQSAVEVQFPGYRPFVLPTLFTRGSGNLTGWLHTLLQCLLSYDMWSYIGL